MLHFRNEEIYELPESEKRAIEQPFFLIIIFPLIFTALFIRKHENNLHYHGNCLYTSLTVSGS